MSSKKERSYSQSVPAVERALSTLETLGEAVDGLTLTQLSRMLGISPSSLSAILNTLVSRNYVSRDPESGRFILGLAVQTLASASEPFSRLETGFRYVAAQLVDITRETCVLWVLDGDDAVVQAVVPGRGSLRLVCPVGARIKASATIAGQILQRNGPSAHSKQEHIGSGQASEVGSVAIGSDPRDPALSYIVAAAVGSDGKPLASIGIGCSTSRLADEKRFSVWASAVEEAAQQLSMRMGWAGSLPTTSGSNAAANDVFTAAGALDPAELSQFLSGARVVHIACIKPDGYPHTVPAWYEWDGNVFWITPRAHAAWAQYLRLNPRVSLAIDEPDPPLRRVLTEGRAELIEEPCRDGRWREVMERMATRYLAERAPIYLQTALSRPHWLFRVTPEQMRSWRGLTSHPKYDAESGSDKEFGVAG